MAYVAPSTAWVDSPSTTTPITAAQLNRMEANEKGISDSALVSPLYFGAVGDGTTDDTTAVQAAFDSGRPVLIDKTFLVGGLTAATGLTVYGTRLGKLLRKSASTYTISINAGSGGSSDPSTNINRVSFLGVTFDDNVAVNTFRQGDAQLNLNACSDVLIQGCTFLAFRSDAIYLGSSNTGATERHNQRIKIIGCLFDGVNKDNRNSISVIDCDDLLVQGCSFRRCTRSDMPGAIDIEPNSGNTFAILRNFKILNNHFDDIGGSACIGTLMQGIGTYTNVPGGWLIEGNIFRNITSTCLPVNLYFSAAATTSSPRQNISVLNNQVFGTRRLVALDGCRGVRVANNDVAVSNYCAVQVGSGFASLDIVIDSNEFFECGASEGGNPAGIVVVNATYVRISSNTFINCGLTDNSWGIALVLGGSGSASDYVDFIDNTIRAGTRMTDTIYKASGHTLGNNRNHVGTIGAVGGTAIPVTNMSRVMPVTLTDGATPALDASLGNHFRLSAAGNRTIAIPTNPTDGQVIVIEHTASGGARTLALNTGTGGFKFGTDITALSATGSGLIDYIQAIYKTGTNKWHVIGYVKGY